MDNRGSSHLSIEDLDVYLLGSPAAPQRKTIEEHYLSCPECLEQICALAARIDKSQLGHQFVPVPISSVPSVPVLQRSVLAIQLPTLAPWQGWALKAVAAGLALLVTPTSSRLVRFDNSPESLLSMTAMNLPFTREAPSLAFLTAPKVELEPTVSRKPRVAQPKVYRRFEAPQAKPVQFMEVAFYEAPDLNFTDSFIEPMPVDLDVAPAVYRSKPNLFKRMLSAFASTFRSGRNY